MTNPVVVGVDASESSGHALEWAADEAWLRHRPLHLLHAWPGETNEAPADQPAGADGERLLASAAERALLRHPGLGITTELADRPARQALADAADTAELLAVGARGSGGFSRLLLGSTSLHAAASARCPVVVVRPLPEGPLQGGVLVGLQGDGRRDDRPLAFAFETAQRRNLPLTAVHAWSYPLVSGPGHALPPVYEEGHIAAEHERLLAELTAQWRQQYPETVVTTTTVRGGAAKELVTSSGSQQLLVVGRSHEPHGPLGRLGSTSQAVVQHAQCPVAVVPEL